MVATWEVLASVHGKGGTVPTKAWHGYISGTESTPTTHQDTCDHLVYKHVWPSVASTVAGCRVLDAVDAMVGCAGCLS